MLAGLVVRDYCPHPMRVGVLSILLSGSALLAVGCNNDGDPPPRGTLYFPNAVALSGPDADGKPHYLFVANNNVDLRYSRGSLQAFSLERIDAAIKRCAGKSGCVIDPTDDGILEDEVLTSSLATSVAVSSEVSDVGIPTGNAFVATRTETSLTYVNLKQGDGGKLEMRCGDGGSDCDSDAIRGDDLYRDTGRIEWPLEPRAVVTGSLADLAPEAFSDATSTSTSSTAPRYALVAHQGLSAQGGALSLFVERRSSDGKAASTFVLADVIEGLAPGLTSLVYDPASRLVHVTSSSGISQGRFIGRVGVAFPKDKDGKPLIEQAKLYNAGSLLLDGVPGIAADQDLAFFDQRLLVVSQVPSTLLVVDTPSSIDAAPPTRARVNDTIVVGAGASQVVTGTIDGQPLALVSCFGSRQLFVIDLTNMLVRSVVPNFSGPFSLALDAFRKKAYIADFSSSVIRIIDLAPVFDGNQDRAARIVATLGSPKILQELK